MRQRDDLVRELDDRFVAANRMAYEDALHLFEGMWQEGVELGVLPGDPWDGLDVDIRVARVFAECSSRS